jgi:hypothetical protein
MKTYELNDIYNKLINQEIKTNFLSRFIESDEHLKDELFSRSGELDNAYQAPTILQRMHFIFNEGCIKKCNCGLPLKWRNFTKGYNKSCGNQKCSAEINVESVKNHYLKKYGVEHLFKTDEFKRNFKKKSLEKYGVDNPWKNEEIKEKIKKTNLEKFGSTSWMGNKENSKKAAESLSKRNAITREKLIEKFNIPITILEFNNSGKIKMECKKCSNISESSKSFFQKNIKIGRNPCFSCNPPLYSESKGEIEIYDFIVNNYHGEVERKNRKILSGKEIDIFLPKLKIGFEFNGIYYHSEIFKNKEEVTEKKNIANEFGINLITIWEDDWEYKKDIIKSRILNLLNKSRKIYARKCEIRYVNVSEEREFLINNHIQGWVPSSIRIGLYFENNLVSIMTFGGYRVALGKKCSDGEYELLRFSNSLKTTVIGGASKIFKEFLRLHKPTKVLSYQNNSWNTGNLYENLGFSRCGLTVQNYYWCKGNIRFNRYNFRKDKLIKEGYDKNLTENDIMTGRGYYKSWDMGNIKWEYSYTETPIHSLDY